MKTTKRSHATNNRTKNAYRAGRIVKAGFYQTLSILRYATRQAKGRCRLDDLTNYGRHSMNALQSLSEFSPV